MVVVLTVVADAVGSRSVEIQTTIEMQTMTTNRARYVDPVTTVSLSVAIMDNVLRPGAALWTLDNVGARARLAHGDLERLGGIHFIEVDPLNFELGLRSDMPLARDDLLQFLDVSLLLLGFLVFLLLLLVVVFLWLLLLLDFLLLLLRRC